MKQPQLVKRLNALLTGERVDEAAGFANTYHSWKGAKEGAIGQASNWTDYVYENAGETYQRESGSPQAHWCAKIDRGSAIANKDTEFLGLEISAVLTVKSRATVHARNELRIEPKGRLILQGGTVESLRWVDVQSGGTLAGHGTVKADLFSKGTLALNLDKPLVVQGAAKLSGKLSLTGVEKVKSGESITTHWVPDK